MSLTRKQAIDEILALFKAAWDTTAYASRVKYDNVGTTSSPPSGQEPWCRVVLRHSASNQATLSGAVGTRRFRRYGVLTVQLFDLPGKGLSGAEDLSKIIMDAYEGKTSPGGVIFRRVRTNEIGPDGDFYQINIVAEFEYDEIK